MPYISVGCDPEITVFDPKGRPVPAHAVGIPNRAMAPPHITTNHGRLLHFRDGYNVEINVPGNHCRALLINAVKFEMQTVAAKLPEGYTLAAKSAFKIRLRAQMAEAPPDVREFGCHPSMCAYTGRSKVPRIDAMRHTWRYAGGHLHFGEYDDDYAKKRQNPIIMPEEHPTLVKLFDIFIGLPLSVIFNDPGQWRRRRYYGQAGEYRAQNYGEQVVGGGRHYKHTVLGVEYRTPPAELFNDRIMLSLFMGVGRLIVNSYPAFKQLLFPPTKQSKRAAAQTVAIPAVLKTLISTEGFALSTAKRSRMVRRAINTGKGAEELLALLNPVVPGFYELAHIHHLRDNPAMKTLNMLNDHTDAHTSWEEYVDDQRRSTDVVSFWPHRAAPKIDGVLPSIPQYLAEIY